jgi:hypothetical protein
VNGKKVHSTQKPEGLLYRIILASSQEGDVILDPFIGTGTTGSVAKKLHRHWIGIEKDEHYVRIAKERIAGIVVSDDHPEAFRIDEGKRAVRRIPFGMLVENGLLNPGQQLYYREDRSRSAIIRADGQLIYGSMVGSIHRIASHLAGGTPMNGWEVWFFEDEAGELKPIDLLRLRIRENGLQ